MVRVRGEREPAWIAPARPPERWAVAQRELPIHLANGERFPETPVRVRWWDNPYPRWAYGARGLNLVLAMVWHLGHGPEGTWVALWRRESAGAAREPDLMFLTDLDQLPSTEGTAHGIVVGEYAPNGALLVELGDRTVQPTYNPQRPYGHMTRHLRN
ncbi:MAG TPA: hypothetical protein VH479_00920 [Acidimicrobiales bacterium]